MSNALDLSGEWTGVYNYPFALPPVDFEAVIHESGDRISGTTSEMGGLSEAKRRLTAVIDGSREGHAVRFLKMYDAADGHYDVVQYSGTVDPEGEEIGGHWLVNGLSGTFLMIRRPRKAESVSLEAEVKTVL